MERPFAHDQASVQGWGRAARLNPELVQATLGGSSQIKCVSAKIELVATLVPRRRAPTERSRAVEQHTSGTSTRAPRYFTLNSRRPPRSILQELSISPYTTSLTPPKWAVEFRCATSPLVDANAKKSEAFRYMIGLLGSNPNRWRPHNS